MKIDWQKTAAILFCALVLLGAFFLIGRYVIAIVMPFLIALLIAIPVHHAAVAIAARTRLPRKLSVVILLLLFFLLTTLLLVLGINRLTQELVRLVDRLASGNELERLMGDLARVGDEIPFLNANDRLRDGLDGMVSSLLREAASTAVSAVTSFATGFLRAMPSIMLFVVVTIISSFYFALDLEAVQGAVLSLLPPQAARRAPQIKVRVRRFAVRYVRVYLLLMLITFLELFTGFTLLRVEYSFLLALAISVVDILPVFGVGTILLPWAVTEFITRDFRMGLGLLALWAVITVARQVTEPRIVGETIGLHPLLTLVGMYVGFRLFGIVGMLLAPALIIAIRTAWREWMPWRKMG